MLLEDLRKLNNELEDKHFLETKIHQQAKKDFQYLCSQTEYSTFNNLHLLTLKTSDGKFKYLGEFLVLGHDVSNKLISFPKNLIDIEKPNHFVAVVCYKKGEVLDVLVFNVQGFKTTSLFGVHKDLSKQNMYGLNISDPENKKLKSYSFGLVLKNLEEN